MIQLQVTSGRALPALPLCLMPLLFTLLATPARGQDSSSPAGAGGGCVVSENDPTEQAEVSCPNVEADIEKHGRTSLREANATLLTSDEELIATSEDVALGLTVISKPSRPPLSADEVFFLYASKNSRGSSSEKRGRPGVEQDGVVKRVSQGENDEGERVASTIYLIGLSEESLQRIANSETFRVKVERAVFDFSEAPMPAQAKAVLEAR